MTTNYPYTHIKGTCKYDGSGVPMIPSCSRVSTYNNTLAIKTRLAKGPVTANVDGDGAMDNYSTGVINTGCTTTTNHAVQIIGYSSTYYIIKNSYGPRWGDAGYAKVGYKGDGEGVCGIQKWVTSPDY